MEKQPPEELSRLSARARREYSHAHMSDTKWRKLFAALRESGLELARAEIKFVDVDEPKPMVFSGNWPWVPHQSYLDTIDFGGVAFREIEWLEFPAVARITRLNNLPAMEVAQDLKAIAATINAIGRYPLVLREDALRLVGYSR